MNISCNVMDDLLPLYAENMVSQDTADLVRDHLAACAVCREKMKAFPEKEEERHTMPPTLSMEAMPPPFRASRIPMASSSSSA